MTHKQELFQEFRNKMFEHLKDKQLVILPTNFQKINPNDRRSTADFFLSLAHGFPSDATHKSTLSVHVYRTKRRESIEQRDQTVVESGSDPRQFAVNFSYGSLATSDTILGNVPEVTKETLHADLEP